MLYKSYSPEETAEIAAELAKSLKSGDVVCLNGDLGVGKTAFVQGLARALGVADYVSSPTFTIVNSYDGSLPLHHFDVYRINDCEEMYEIGYEEYIYGDGISVIEWAENISDILPCERYDVTVSKNLDVDIDYREIVIEKRSKNENFSS